MKNLSWGDILGVRRKRTADARVDLYYFGALLITAIALGTALMVSLFRDRALAESERELKNTALILAEQIDRSFQAIDLVQTSVLEKIAALGIISSAEYEHQLSSQDVHLMLNNKIDGLPYVAGLNLIDAHGKLINISRLWPTPVANVADREYFKAFKSNTQLSVLVSEPVRNRANGEWTIVLARKITAPNGDFIGLISSSIELSYFEKLFGSIVLGEHSTISLYRRDGVQLARYPHIESFIGKSFSFAIDALGNGNSGTIRFVGKTGARERILAAHRLAHYPLHLSVAADIDAVLAGWKQETKVLLGAGALVAVAIALMFFLILRRLAKGHRHSQQQLTLEKQRLDTAINNMSQGLLLFDSTERIVVCNQRYIEMYGLSPEVIKPGCAFSDLISHRKERGSFSGEVDEYRSNILRNLSQGKPTEFTIETTDGRSIWVVNHPMASGGWVATHEDVTERHRLMQAQNKAESLLRKQTQQLEAALDNMMQGLCMFDADGNIVLFNQRYAKMMGIPASDLTGLSLLDVFKHRKAKGQFTGDPEKFITGVLDAVRAGISTTNIMVSIDERALRVVDHPMADGGGVATFEDITEQRSIEQERDRDRVFLNQIIDNVPVMIAVKDAVTRKFVLANRAAEEFWGVTRAEALGRTAREIFPRVQADMIDRSDDDVIRSDCPLTLDAHPNMVRLGKERVVTSKRLAIRDADGKATFLVSVVEDVTARKLVEQERDRGREFLDQIVKNVPATIVVKDARSRKYILINPAGEQAFGTSRDQIIGKTAHEIWPKATADVIVKHDDSLMQSGGLLAFEEFTLNTPGRGERLVISKKLMMRDGQGDPQYLLGVIEDVTERKRSEDRIAHLAHYDALTDLPNRVLFREQLEQSLKGILPGGRVAVLYLDLDHFKSANDTHGHPVGDELLKVVASRLRGCISDADTVARLGGDEFAIIQGAVMGSKDVVDLVARIHDAIREPCEAGGHQLVADTSIGIAIAPDDGADPDQLLKNADLAMYRAKNEGRGTYRFFEPGMDARVKARCALEFDLREAIMCGGFELHYQPLVNLENNTISGCEALLRWHHPSRGMISPVEFIPIAEETGLITVLGEWVLRTACAEAVTWPDHIKVAVNVSPVQFKSENLVQVVVNALAASRLPAHRLELEITEAVLIRDDDATLSILHQLRKLGVRIAMDDFGTGYSSLSYLRRFPFDKIKIDRSFINDVTDEDGSLSIVQAVVGIAKSRNIATVAEGVETTLQLELLRKLGCTEMQGYLFSRPQPAAEILRLFPSARIEALGAA